MWVVCAGLLLALVNCGDRRAEPTRCTLRVSAKALYVDGDPKSQAEAVALCKRRAAAMVVLEDDAHDRWKTVEPALRREGITIHLRGPLGHAVCDDNPLAQGCM